MKNIYKIFLLLIVVLISASWIYNLAEPWKAEQLLEPKELAKSLSDGDTFNDPVIINIGPSGAIRGSVEVGSVDTDKKLKSLKDKIKSYPKDTDIVLYCGCCPFEHCPNIRPAFELLNQKGFKNHKLLNLPQNLKVDWIDKGYPME